MRADRRHCCPPPTWRCFSRNTQQVEIDLLEIPAKRRDLSHTDVLASLKDALDLLNESGKEALYVTARGSGPELIYGVLTREAIERSYRMN